MKKFSKFLLEYDPNQLRAPKGVSTGGQWVRRWFSIGNRVSPEMMIKILADPYAKAASHQLDQIVWDRIKKRNNKVVVYHGTSKAVINDILKFGLKPHASQGADTWMRMQGYVLDQFTAGERALNVYFTDSIPHAQAFAKLASQVTKADPIIIEIELPETELNNIKRDQEGEHGMFQYQGEIKPEYIKGTIEFDSQKDVNKEYQNVIIERYFKIHKIYAVILP